MKIFKFIKRLFIKNSSECESTRLREYESLLENELKKYSGYSGVGIIAHTKGNKIIYKIFIYPNNNNTPYYYKTEIVVDEYNDFNHITIIKELKLDIINNINKSKILDEILINFVKDEIREEKLNELLDENE